MSSPTSAMVIHGSCSQPPSSSASSKIYSTTFLSGITGAHEKNNVNAAIMLPTRLTVGLIVFGPLVLSFAVCWIPSMIGRAYLSRAREYLADAGAVEITKDSDALVAALLRIDECNEHLAIPSSMQAMMIAGDARSVLATHPTIEDRIAALRAYAGAQLPTLQSRRQMNGITEPVPWSPAIRQTAIELCRTLTGSNGLQRPAPSLRAVSRCRLL